MEWIKKYSPIITLALFLASVIGWYIDSSVSKRIMEKTLTENTKKIKKMADALEKQNTINGQFIMYIKMNSNVNIDNENP